MRFFTSLFFIAIQCFSVEILSDQKDLVKIFCHTSLRIFFQKYAYDEHMCTICSHTLNIHIQYVHICSECAYEENAYAQCKHAKCKRMHSMCIRKNI